MDIDVIVGTGHELESMMLAESNISCGCSHGAGEIIPGGHSLSGFINETHKLPPCSKEALWLGINPFTTENKQPYYLCDSCGGYWQKEPFNVILEALK